MKELMFFDANAQIGDNNVLGPQPGAAELLAEMDRNGVDYALVRHGDAAAIGAVVSNQQLAEFLADEPSGRLTGVWSFLPPHSGELPEPEIFFRQMKSAKIKALTLFPIEHRFEPSRIVIGKMVDAATERKIPILLHDFIERWHETYEFMKEFPKAHVIVNAGFKWGTDHWIRPLLETYENLSVELAGYWMTEGIYDLARKYGANRFLYGSHFPGYNHGNGMLQLRHSMLEEAEIARIAGLNLKEMLEAVEL